MLVNSQLVCLPPVGILNQVMFIYLYLFTLVLKSPDGEWPITYTFTFTFTFTYCNLAKVASLFWICFSIEIRLRTCGNFPPFKSLLTNICTYHSSLFHSYSNKKVFIKGELVRYVRNSSSFDSFYETREKFWKRLHVRG